MYESNNRTALAAMLLVTACSSSTATPPMHEPSSATAAPDPHAATKIVVPSELAWEHLNPARGDKAPQAATLWGDRNGAGATGFLLKPKDGFESPPHIHNVTYRGVVIRGLIHNDHPDAETTWMPAGSYWTQPKGGVHITSAKGSDVLAIIEIEEGPYLVKPIEEAFENEEPPKNIDAADVAWRASPGAPAGIEISELWRAADDAPRSGTLVKLPAGKASLLRSSTTHQSPATLHAVVIQGRPEHRAAGKPEVTRLEPGSYFSSKGSAAHAVSCPAEAGCMIYVRMEGGDLELGAP